jgi:hypothetical protein
MSYMGDFPDLTTPETTRGSNREKMRLAKKRILDVFFFFS